MKKILFYIFLLFVLNVQGIDRLIPSSDPQKGVAISYSLSGGRLGDNLIAYLHAKWIAYKHQLPLLIIPFPDADKFKFHESEQMLEPNIAFEKVVYILSEQDIDPHAHSTLYIVPFFPECKYEFDTMFPKTPPFWPYFEVDWNDPLFHAEVVKCVAPKGPVNTLQLPGNQVTVGVHVRRGGGVDPEQHFKMFPLKFPPDSFYIAQLKRLTERFKNQQLYVYIFTDDLKPKTILKAFKKALKGNKMTFSCSEAHGPHKNILEDFFSLAKFDCLILGQSHFSIVASKLGSPKVVIRPEHCTRRGMSFVIDEISWNER